MKMITAQNNLIGKISAKQNITGRLNNAVVREYPELEDLIVTPTAEQQTFKSDKYGYDNVIVEAIETEELNILPSTEKQLKEGIFNKVTVAGDSNLIPENIKEGTEIFGVTGIAKTKGEENAIMIDVISNSNNSNSFKSMFVKLVDSIDTSELTTHNSLFSGCVNLLEIPTIDTSKSKDMSYMYYNCKKITSIPTTNTIKVTNMSAMCDGCSNLQTFPKLDTSSVTNMYRLCADCLSLVEFPEIDTSNVYNMSTMFNYDTSLVTIAKLKCDKVSNIYAIVTSSCNIENLGGFENLGKAYTQKSNNYYQYTLSLNGCSKLTHESLMNVINNLYDLNLTYDVANGGTLYTQSLILGAINLAKLTAEEIEIAAKKGWTVS